MPRRIYHAHEPPTILDHVLSHPWEMTAAVFGALFGTLGVGATLAGTSLSPSLSRLPDALVVAFCALLAVGGTQILRGLLDDSEDLMVGWTRERTGLVFLGSGWLVYGVVVAVSGGSFVAWGLASTFVASCGLRLAATVREEHTVREAS